ncbi:MAG: restriction endonuclease subunit S [Lentisphaeria bacterium]|nr:restriction endonuclease subunit S [Lentisphaeria bacterium]
MKLSEICTLTKGCIGITKAVPGQYPMVTLAEERRSHTDYQFDAAAVIIPLVSSTGHGHASLKRIHYQEGKFALGSILCAVIPKNPNEVSAQYLYHYLDLMKEVVLVPLMKGMANVSLPMKRIATVRVPVPPMSEQESLVAMMEGVVARQTDVLTEITRQKALLEKLRQAILQEAIEGKLTADWRKQHPDIEPASELLERIAAEKDRLVKDGQIRKQKPLLPIRPDEIPFLLPEGWAWCRLVDLCEKIGSGSTPRGGKSVYKRHGVPFLRSQNIQNFGIVDDDIALIGSETHQRMKGTHVLPEDVLLNITGASLGRCAVVCSGFGQANVSQHVCIVRPIAVSADFLHKVLLSIYGQKMIFESVTGAGREGLPKNRLETFPTPIAPLSEQRAIVERVQAKLALCDQLAAEIDKAEAHAQSLSTTILQEVFGQESNGGSAG